MSLLWLVHVCNRWAVSSVMTRQNQIPTEDGSRVTLALIPLWDMCNHTNGLVQCGTRITHTHPHTHYCRFCHCNNKSDCLSADHHRLQPGGWSLWVRGAAGLQGEWTGYHCSSCHCFIACLASLCLHELMCTQRTEKDTVMLHYFRYFIIPQCVFSMCC